MTRECFINIYVPFTVHLRPIHVVPLARLETNLNNVNNFTHKFELLLFVERIILIIHIRFNNIIPRLFPQETNCRNAHNLPVIDIIIEITDQLW